MHVPSTAMTVTSWHKNVSKDVSGIWLETAYAILHAKSVHAISTMVTVRAQLRATNGPMTKNVPLDVHGT